jgi:hypothetical protein
VKDIHRNCGSEVETIYREKDLDGDGVRRMHPDYECDACGWVPFIEVRFDVDGESKYPRARMVHS